jgi:hypothetical protein
VSTPPPTSRSNTLANPQTRRSVAAPVARIFTGWQSQLNGLPGGGFLSLVTRALIARATGWNQTFQIWPLRAHASFGIRHSNSNSSCTAARNWSVAAAEAAARRNRRGRRFCNTPSSGETLRRQLQFDIKIPGTKAATEIEALWRQAK